MKENHEKRYIGIDIGTTSLKAASFDENGRRLGLRCIQYPLDTDPKTGFVEADPEQYIRMCEQAIAELTEECGTAAAISVDTQGETLILADREGRALYPAVVWLDNRAAQEAKEIRAHFGTRRVYEVTGQPEITAAWPACKLLWFRRHRPEIFDRTEKIFLLEDWILFRLTEKFVTEPTIQSSSIYYDIRAGQWWTEMLELIGVRPEQLPRLVPSAAPVGHYRGVPVVAGALDQIAGMIGAGVCDGSEISEMTGTTMAICSMTDRIPPYREDSIVPCHVHAIPGQYCRILWSSTAGMALKWFRDSFAEQYRFDELDALAENIPAGCDGLTALPYLCGATMPRYRPDARAVFAGVHLSHTRAHFARAIMESVAFILRQNIEYIGGMSSIRGIRITGGGANSRLWAQIKADVTGKELHTVAESETACLGTAILAAVGVGDFASVAKAARKLVCISGTFRPSGEQYEQAYRRFLSLDGWIDQLSL